jgi:hypothetical protein
MSGRGTLSRGPGNAGDLVAGSFPELPSTKFATASPISARLSRRPRHKFAAASHIAAGISSFRRICRHSLRHWVRSGMLRGQDVQDVGDLRQDAPSPRQ